MTNDDLLDSAPQPLPLSYKIVLAVSLALLSGLGFLFFSQMHRQLDVSFQVYGPTVLLKDHSSLLRLVQYDNVEHRNLPAHVASVTVSQQGRTVPLEGSSSSVPTLPADFRITRVAGDEGDAEIAVEIVGWNDERRSLVFPLRLVEPGTLDRADSAARIPPVQGPQAGPSAQLSMVLTGGGVAERVPCGMWLRLADPQGRAASLPFSWRLDGRQNGAAESSGRLGIVPLVLTVAGPNQPLAIDVLAPGAVVTWKETIAPDRLARLEGPSNVIRSDGPADIPLTLFSSGEDLEFYCYFWKNAALLDVASLVPSEQGSRHTFTAPGPGLYWITCSDSYMSTDEFPLHAPALVLAANHDPLEMLLPLHASDPLVASWPPTAGMSSDEHDLATRYLLSTLQPAAARFVQLANTHAADALDVRGQSSSRRDILLVLLGLVGFGLLFWTAAVIVRQRLGVKSSFAGFPIVLVLLAAAANLVAILWALRLAFG